MSKLVPYIFSHDYIMQAVKQESSLYAERQVNEDGDSLFDFLVFDEEYFRKFRELFFDAQAEVINKFGAYLMYETETDGYFFEESDFSKDRDFTFNLLMPCDYNHMYNKQVSIKVREYLIAYIMYRWLETKVPGDAVVFKTRAEKALIDARAYLEKRLAKRRGGGGNFI